MPHWSIYQPCVEFILTLEWCTLSLYTVMQHNTREKHASVTSICLQQTVFCILPYTVFLPHPCAHTTRIHNTHTHTHTHKHMYLHTNQEMSRSTGDIGDLELAGLSEAELRELSEFIDPDVCHHFPTSSTMHSTCTSTHADMQTYMYTQYT